MSSCPRAIARCILIVLAGALLGSSAFAQETPKAPSSLREIDQSAIAMPAVSQDGDRAAAIREMLGRIVLPQGFKIGLYAIVPGARQMAVGPKAGVVFVGTRGTSVWAVIRVSLPWMHRATDPSRISAIPGIQ